MNPNNIPQQLANIPYGQIFILTSPNKGITVLHIRMMEIIRGVSRHYHPECIIQTMAVDNPELWDCAVCKVKMKDGDEMVIANRTSLLEMLCDIWDLDQVIVCDEGKLWHVSRNLPEVGEKHPTRVSIEPTENREEDKGILLQSLPAYTRERILGDFKGIWQDNFNHSVGVTIEDLADIIKEVESSRRKYKLKFKIKKKKVQKDDEVIVKLDSFDVILTDNNGKEYPLGHWVPQVTALYLTFILFKDGIKCEELFYNEEFYNTFIKILHQFPYGSRTPSMGILYKNADSKLSVIRGAILSATDDNYAKEQFAIDGYSQEIYRVVGATDADRAIIKKTFGIE